MTPTISTTRRKPTKRAVVESEDEDNYEDDVPRSAPSRHVSQPPTKRPRRTSTADLDAEDMDVDVETEFASTAADDVRLEPDVDVEGPSTRPSLARASSSQKKDKEKNRAVVPPAQSRRESMPRRKAKRHVVLSDDDDGAKEEQSDEDYVGDEGPKERRVARDAYVEPGDEDFAPEPKRNTAKAKAPKGGVLKGKGRGAAKEKEKVDKPIKIKDERRMGAAGAKAKDGDQIGASSETKRRARPDESTPPEAAVDVDSLPSGPSDASLAAAPEPPTKETAPLPSFKKRQKFPTIKKNKPALGGSAGDTSGQAAKGRGTADVDGKVDDGVLTKKQPKAPAKVEVDLMNKSVYDSLFKGVRLFTLNFIMECPANNQSGWWINTSIRSQS